MKKRIALITSILAVATLAATPLAAHPGGGGRWQAQRHGAGADGSEIVRHLQHAKEELGLSDEQVGKIVGIFGELKEQNAQHRDEMRGGMHEVLNTLLADPTNVAGAQALIDERAAAERAMHSNLLNATAKALSVLTAEQRAKLGTLMAERHGRRGR